MIRMEDTLEDYIRISQYQEGEALNRVRKEVQLSAQIKKECDIRALKIVEFSIEGKLRPEIFIKCLPYINQSHYQDIVEERSITKLCGYSVCGKKIPDMPRKQYYISTKSNKIYDITDRKNYCSNFCYKASLHIKNQIDDSPLWMRKLDEIPKYQLLEASEGGLPGDYIDYGVAKSAIEPTFTPVALFTQASLHEMVEKEKTEDKAKRKGLHRKIAKTLKTTMQTIDEKSEQIDEESEILKKEIPTSSKKLHRRHEHSNSPPSLPVIEENEEKMEIKCVTMPSETVKEHFKAPAKRTKKPKSKGSKTQNIDVESLIKKVLREWLTLESYIFLYGESKIREVLNEKKLGDYFEKLHMSVLERKHQVRYMEICTRLQLQEMADDKFDKAFIGNTNLRPVPDYKKLKEENKDMNIRVKCFLSGVVQEKEDPNFSTKFTNSNKNTEIAEDESPTVIPLVAANSQNALRRKIFLTSINKSMQHLLDALRVDSYSMFLSDLQSLVKTFKLKADNIVFKPLVWNIVAIVLLNMLSIKDQSIGDILNEESSKEHLELQLATISSNNEFIRDLITEIENIDHFVEEYISSN